MPEPVSPRRVVRGRIVAQAGHERPDKILYIVELTSEGGVIQSAYRFQTGSKLHLAAILVQPQEFRAQISIKSCAPGTSAGRNIFTLNFSFVDVSDSDLIYLHEFIGQKVRERKEKRICAILPVRFDFPNVPGTSRTLDVSGSGVRVACEKKLPRGTFVRFSIQLLPAQTQVSFDGLVLHCTRPKRELERWALGLQIINPAENSLNRLLDAALNAPKTTDEMPKDFAAPPPDPEIFLDLEDEDLDEQVVDLNQKKHQPPTGSTPSSVYRWASSKPAKTNEISPDPPASPAPATLQTDPTEETLSIPTLARLVAVAEELDGTVCPRSQKLVNLVLKMRD